MSPIILKQTGKLKKTTKFLKKIMSASFFNKLESYGKEGVAALSSFTPVDSGRTSEQWDYRISRSNDRVSIYWTNHNRNQGVLVAILIQYGHFTGTGGYVEGIDYINPALRPIFDKMAKEIWEEVVS